MIRRPSATKRPSGFTLIEILLVVAVIGVIAAILIPNLLDAIQKSKQKRTMTDMREVGTAWMAWLGDQVAGAAAGATTTLDVDGTFNVVLTPEELAAILRPDEGVLYAARVPSHDSWGTLFDYLWTGMPDTRRVLAIRSLGRDRVPGPVTNPYPARPFLATDYDQDIVWTDGFFLRYPTGMIRVP